MKTILIIDEEKISVNGIVFDLENSFSDIVILKARTCSEGLEMAVNNKVDLIILDMMLPQGNLLFIKERIDFRYGIDLLMLFRKKEINLPIICYTIINNDDELVNSINEFDGIYICKLSESANSDLIYTVKSKLAL